MLGFSRETWGSIPLPRTLWMEGFPGCTQYVSIDAHEFVANVGGTATWDIFVPNGMDLAGLEFFVQAIVPDPGPLGLGLTRAGAGVIGIR